jgi:hypothetical protein
MIEDKEKLEGPGFDCRVEYEPGSDREVRAGKAPPVPGDHDGGGVYVCPRSPRESKGLSVPPAALLGNREQSNARLTRSGE